MIMGEALVLLSNNATVVTYLKKQGETVYLDLCMLTQEIITWSKLHMVSFSALCILEKNIIMDWLSCPDQVLSTEWFLLPWVFDDICRELSCHLVDPFATRVNVKLPIYLSPIPDPVAWKENAFQYPWDYLSLCSSSASPIRSNALSKPLHGPDGSSVAIKGMVPRSSVFFLFFFYERTSSTPQAVEPASSAPSKDISQRSRVIVPTCVEVIKHLICKAGFCKEVVEICCNIS